MLMRMFIIASATLWQLVAVGSGTAQDLNLSREAIDVGAATVEWYAGHAADYLRRKGATLVVSQETNGFASILKPGSDRSALERSSRASFEFAPATLRSLERHAGG